MLPALTLSPLLVPVDPAASRANLKFMRICRGSERQWARHPNQLDGKHTLSFSREYSSASAETPTAFRQGMNIPERCRE
eukprot:4397428-Heterocapsa_arctica.AAC.1